jgi:hypothetical protein
MVDQTLSPFYFRKVYGAIFFASLATLGFEVLLTRIFSIVLWYHFAFMVVSIAMLGLALSGTLLAVAQNSFGAKPELRGSYFLFLAVTMVAAYLIAVRIPFDPVKLSWDRWQLVLISSYYLTLSIPFVAAGLVLASAFSSLGGRSGRLYGADLLGAASGSILVLVLQNWFAPGQAVFLFAAVSLAGAMLLGSSFVRRLAAILFFLFAAVVAINPLFIGVKMSPYKELPTMLGFMDAKSLRTVTSPYARIDLFTSPGVHYAPGLSLRYGDDLPAQVGVAVDGGGVTAVTLRHSKENGDFLPYLPAALAFELKPGGEVLLINPGGGLPILLAKKYGAVRVEPVEMNPKLVEVLRSDASLGGGLYGEDTRTGLARSLLSHGGRRYDIIDLPLTGSLNVGFLGAGEDYQLTVEAFRSYLGALNEKGVLNVTAYIVPPYRTELRLLTTAISALERLGAADPGSHIAAIRSLGVVSILVKRTPFGSGELSQLRKFSSHRWFDPVFFRGMRPSEANLHIRSRSDDLAGAFAALTDPERRAGFMAEYTFDISPTTDERPFFHDHLRLKYLRETYELVQGKWEFFVQEGYLVPALFIQVALLGLLLVVAPGFALRRRIPERGGSVLVYFALLGIGYMFIEIALIQKSILPLEHPVYAVATVLGTLLVSSGAGSLVGQRFGTAHLKPVTLALSVVVFCSVIIYPPLVSMISGAPLVIKGMCLFLFLFPLGFLMGMPFPGGVRMLSVRDPSLIPWAWAVNGFFSVIAPVLSVMLAMKLGFSGVLGLAAVAYFGAFGISRGFSTSPTMGTKATGPS